MSDPNNFPPGENFYFDFEFQNSWTEQFGLYCGDSYILGTSKTIILLINTGLIFFNNQLTDIAGRKSALLLVCFVSLLIIIPPFFGSLYIKVIAFGLAYGSINSIDGLFPPVITEATDRHSRIPEVVLCISYMVNALAIVILNVSLIFVGFGTNVIFIGCFFYTIFGLFPWIFLMAESPIYLFRKGLVNDLVNSLHRIATINFRGIKRREFLEDIVGVEISDLMQK